MTAIDWSYAWRCLPALAEGLRLAAGCALGASCLALVLGLVWAIALSGAHVLARRVVRLIVDLIAGTPLLVQLYALYFAVPGLGAQLSPALVGLLGLGLHYSAYLADVYRAGIESVPQGQWEAARVLGLSRTQTFRRVILPQALPPMLPAIGNYVVAMLKDTPVLSAITVVETMQAAKLLGAAEFRYLEPFTLVGIAFLLITTLTSRALQRIEVRR